MLLLLFVKACLTCDIWQYSHNTFMTDTIELKINHSFMEFNNQICAGFNKLVKSPKSMYAL